jgi:CHASE2 domain-containing sensor protein
MTWIKKLRRFVSEPLRHLPPRFWVTFLVASICVFSLEALFDYYLENDEAGPVTQSVFGMSGVYQGLVASPHKPVWHYTVTIEINPRKDPKTPPGSHICAQREMTAELLRTVASAWPGVIVLDKYYQPGTPCIEDSKLEGAIAEVRKETPIVVGRLAEDEGSPGNFYLAPSLIDSPSRLEGVVNIDPDTRKAPLRWPLYPTEVDARARKGISGHDTLALAAARAYDPELFRNHPKLEGFARDYRNPYVSFLKDSEGRSILVCQVLGGECPAPQVNKRVFSGKIVLIGEINSLMDSHPTPIGNLSGLYIQANYIEALIDDRYFRPLPVLDYVFGFIFLAGFELIVYIYHGRSVMLVFIPALFCTTFLALYLIVMHWQWYVNPLPVTAAAVVLRLLHVLNDFAVGKIGKGKKRQVARPASPRP